jgi:hypothetical protein
VLLDTSIAQANHAMEGSSSYAVLSHVPAEKWKRPDGHTLFLRRVHLLFYLSPVESYAAFWVLRSRIPHPRCTLPLSACIRSTRCNRQRFVNSELFRCSGVYFREDCSFLRREPDLRCSHLWHGKRAKPEHVELDQRHRDICFALKPPHHRRLGRSSLHTSPHRLEPCPVPATQLAAAPT